MKELIRGLRRRSRKLVYEVGRGALYRLGYEVELVGRRATGPSTSHRVGEGDGRYRPWSSPGPVWTPWLSDRRFLAAYEGVSPHTVVDVDRCYVLYALARQARHLEGDCAECGVFNGGTALLLSRTLAGAGKTLYLFDSFAGLPAPSSEHDTLLEGTFRSASESAVRELLRPEPSRAELRVGWIPETFVGLESARFAFVHVDVDLYQGALDCCEFFYPRMPAGGILVFDDHGFPDTEGLRLAVAEFFDGRPETPLALPTGQAIVVRLPDDPA